ncbi:ferrous iron transport protein A [Streptococcus hongkongensis]|nr:iron transporter FeoA [Streptococcus uberis]
MNILQAEIGKKYIITSINLPDSFQRYLSHLGMLPDRQVMLISKTKVSAILILAGQRLAFDKSILENIVVEVLPDSQNAIPLTDLFVGEVAYIETIYTAKETKRHLMDMGLTKGTQVKLIKVAPLGDPIEISIRGFELTLRKSEAQLISVNRR